MPTSPSPAHCASRERRILGCSMSSVGRRSASHASLCEGRNEFREIAQPFQPPA